MNKKKEGNKIHKYRYYYKINGNTYIYGRYSKLYYCKPNQHNKRKQTITQKS